MTWLARSYCPAATRRCSGVGEGRIERCSAMMVSCKAAVRPLPCPVTSSPVGVLLTIADSDLDRACDGRGFLGEFVPNPTLGYHITAQRQGYVLCWRCRALYTKLKPIRRLY